MHIDPKSQMAEVPAMQVRDFLHRIRESYWSGECVASHLKLSDDRAGALVADLFSATLKYQM